MTIQNSPKMAIKTGKALLAFKDEIKHKNALDFVKSHISFLKPLHFHEGELALLDNILRFTEDKGNADAKLLEIERGQIADLFLGFDDVFHRTDDRSLGITMEPLRITYKKDSQEFSIYLFIDHNRLTRTNKNTEWYSALKEWNTIKQE